MKYNKARDTPGSRTSCCKYTSQAPTKGTFEKLWVNLLLHPKSTETEFSLPGEIKPSLSGEIDVISSISLRKSREILLWLLSVKAGMPLCTDVKSQYSSHTAIVFQIAKVIAEALTDTKLMMKPLITGARSLQVKSIRLIIELILVRTPGGWPSDITTTLHFENNYHHIRKCKTTAPLEIILLSLQSTNVIL